MMQQGATSVKVLVFHELPVRYGEQPGIDPIDSQGIGFDS